MTDAAVDIDRVKRPRDLIDVLALLGLVAGQTCVFFGSPICLAIYLLANWRIWPLGAAAIPLAPVLLLLAAEAVFNGSGLSLDATGVHLKRLLGGRRCLARWCEISSVEPVGRFQAWFVGTFTPWRMLG